MNKDGFLRFSTKIFTNKIFIFIGSRYFIYAIQFINSILVAKYLGPYYLGIWGFILLIIQYINQINFGIAYSANAILSIKLNEKWYVEKIVGVSFTMIIFLSVLVMLIFSILYFFKIDLGGKYNFLQFSLLIAFIGVLGYFNSFFSNIFRVYGKLKEIIINQSAPVVFIFITLLFFKKKNLLWALVISYLLSFLFSLLIYLIKSPVKLRLLFIKRLYFYIQKKGWYLFIYNASFYLILISTKTLISSFFTVDEFGYFTFAFSLSNAILLLLQSFSFIIFPKLINRFASFTNNEEIKSLLNKVRNSYIVLSHFLIHLAILFFPLFILILPQYSQTTNVFRIIALAMVLYSNSFGYQGLLIAKGYEKKLAYIAVFVLFLNVLISIILIKVFLVNYYFLVFSVIIAYMIFIYLIGLLGLRVLKQKSSFYKVLREMFPLNIMIPYLLQIVCILFDVNNITYLIPVVIFILLNYKVLLTLNYFINKLIANPKLTDI